MHVEGSQLQLRGSIDIWNRWALITLRSSTRTGVNALFVSAITLDRASHDSGPSGEDVLTLKNLSK